MSYCTLELLHCNIMFNDLYFITSRHARKYSSTVKNLCLEGIPAVIRHDAWPLLIENTLNVSYIHIV